MTEAVDELLARHRPLIRRVVRHVAGRRAESVLDDVEQKVMIGVWRRLQGEQALELTPSYLYKAALRETVRTLRQESARRVEPLGDGLSEPPAEAPGPADELRGRERGEAIEACLQELAPERQRAVRLHLLGFRVEEMMTVCGWPYQKARNLIARGMADLRVALRSRGIDD